MRRKSALKRPNCLGKDAVRSARLHRLAATMTVVALGKRQRDLSSDCARLPLGGRDAQFQAIQHEVKERLPTVKDEIARQGFEVIEKSAPDR